MSHPICEMCKFWSPMDDASEWEDELGKKSESTTHGFCHRYPPVIKPPKKTTWLEWGYPVTDAVNWCGEWAIGAMSTNEHND